MHVFDVDLEVANFLEQFCTVAAQQSLVNLGKKIKT
jgi:hypothetical protein